MMLKATLVGIFLSIPAGCFLTVAASGSLYPELVGKPYLQAKRDLIKIGASPIDERSNSICTLSGSVCSLHEVTACAIDQRLCTMGWKDKHGRIFTLETVWSKSPSITNQKVGTIWWGDPAYPK